MLCMFSLDMRKSLDYHLHLLIVSWRLLPPLQTPPTAAVLLRLFRGLLLLVRIAPISGSIFFLKNDISSAAKDYRHHTQIISLHTRKVYCYNPQGEFSHMILRKETASSNVDLDYI